MGRLSDRVVDSILNVTNLSDQRFIIYDVASGRFINSELEETANTIHTYKKLSTRSTTFGLGPTLNLKETSGHLELYNVAYNTRSTPSICYYDNQEETPMAQPVFYPHAWHSNEAVIISTEDTLASTVENSTNDTPGKVKFLIHTFYMPLILISSSYKFKFAKNAKGVRWVVRLGSENGPIWYTTADDMEYIEGIGQDIYAWEVSSVVADPGNTGDGTATVEIDIDSQISETGSYTLECENAVSQTFKLVSPSLAVLQTGIQVGTQVITNGLQITVNAGTVGYELGDKFTVNVAETITTYNLPNEVGFIADSIYHMTFENIYNNVDMKGGVGELGYPEEFSPWFMRTWQYAKYISVITDSMPYVKAEAMTRHLGTDNAAVVTMVSGTTTISGSSSCQFTADFLPGESLRLGNSTYIIQSVDSDTQITTLSGAARDHINDVLYSNSDLFRVSNSNNDTKLEVDRLGDIYTYGDAQVSGTIAASGTISAPDFEKNHVVVPNQSEIYNYSTGWLDGGVISINGGDNTKIDITAGSVLITDYTDQLNPTIKTISWTNQTALDPALSGRNKWIGVKDNGSGEAEFVYDVNFDSVERRSSAILGRIWDNAGTGPQITNTAGYERPSWGLLTAFQDFVIEYGSWNISGNTYSPNGANLYLDKSSGTTFRYHAQDTVGAENVHTEVAQTPRTPYAYHLQGQSTTTSETTIDPNNYDASGVKTAVPANKWTIQEIWFFPVSGTCHVLYGQAYYSSKGDALLAISTEKKVRNVEILDGSVKRAYLIVQQGCTELNDMDAAELREVNGMYAEGGGGSAYWERDNSTLQPAETGDGLLIESGGTLTIQSLTPNTAVYTDASNNLVSHTGSGTQGYWDLDGTTLKNASGTNFQFYDGTRNRIEAHSGTAEIVSPDGSLKIGASDTLAYMATTARNRVFIDTNETELVGPDGTVKLEVGNDEVSITGDFSVTGSGVVGNGLILAGGNIKFDTASAKIYASDSVGYIQFNTGGALYIHDGTRPRLTVASTITEINSPDGDSGLTASNGGVQMTSRGFELLESTATRTRLFSPDNSVLLEMTDSLFKATDVNRDRIISDATKSSLVSPDGTNTLEVNNTGTDVSNSLWQPVFGDDRHLIIDVPMEGIGVNVDQHSRGNTDNVFEHGSSGVQVVPNSGPFGGVAGYFDGLNDKLQETTVSGVTFGTSEKITVECWARSDDTSSGNSIWEFQGATNPDYQGMALTPNGADAVRVVFGDGTGDTAVSLSATAPSAIVNWHRYTVTLDRTTDTLKIWIDGVLKNTGSTSTEGGAWTEPIQLALGAAPNSTYDVTHWLGHMAGFKVYNRILHDDEIRSHYLRRGSSVVRADTFRVINNSNTVSFEVDKTGHINPGVATHFGGDVHLGGTKLYASDGTGYLQLNTSGQFWIHDGTRTRLFGNNSETELSSPNGQCEVTADNTGIWMTQGGFNILEGSNSTTKLYSPDNNAYFEMTNSLFRTRDANRDRILADSTKSSLVSPDGTDTLEVSNSYTQVKPKLRVLGSTATDCELWLVPGEWSSSGDYATMYWGDTSHYIKGEHSVGMTLYDYNSIYLKDSNRTRLEILNTDTKLYSPDGTTQFKIGDTNIVAGTEGWAGRLEVAPYGDTESGGAMVFKGGEKAGGGYHSDLHIDDFYGYCRIYIANSSADTYLRVNNGSGGYKMNLEIDGGIKVGTNGTSKTASAGIEISSTTEALLLSRMTTTQRNALTATQGLMIFNTTTSKAEVYDGSTWQACW
jgi:hypothetical protein